MATAINDDDVFLMMTTAAIKIEDNQWRPQLMVTTINRDDDYWRRQLLVTTAFNGDDDC